MSDLTTPARTRQRRRRIRRRLLRQTVHGLRGQLRRTRVIVGLATTVGLAGWGSVALNERPPEAAPPQAVELGSGVAGVNDVPRAPVAKPEPAPEPAPPAEESPEPDGETLGSGEASYYGQELAGNRTASGERFDPEGLTAAHRTLPLGSRLRVTNPQTGESVIVRVNDRGPFAADRVVDVSERAARELGMLRAGTARVELELLPKRKG
ncbi:MAG TPA: septal ring lytic transglycosylase RlpA family protein [Bacteroidetes bacterium]|nr:septal ring lytic transglycosylase RlpA family protein [Bacteroidota bacterium]